MTELGYKPFKTVSVGEDLIYKYSKLWNLTKITGIEDFNSLLLNIMMEDVGVEISDLNLNDVEQFTNLRRSLEILLSNKKCVKKSFSEKVKNFGKEEETGRNVGMMVKKSLEFLIPSDLIGGKNNKNRYILSVMKALTFGNKDAVPIKLFMNGIQFKQIVWFRKLKNPSLKLKTNLTAKLLLWLWRISKKLIATQYYVSEMQGCYNRLTYIYKSVWQKHTDRAFKFLVSCGSLRYLDPEEAKKMLGCRRQAKLRWLPKDKIITIGLRPIISVRNDKLQEDTIFARSFLNCILKLMGKDLTMSNLPRKWKEAVEVRTSLDVPQQYFVAVDVKDAYGSVIQDKLVDIVKQTISIHLRNTEVVQFDIGICGRRRVVTCRELYSGPIYHVLASKKVSVKHLLKTIETVITCQTVKWDNKTYLMSKGISQAVSLSAALCKLYLAHLDQTHLSGFTVAKGDILLRAVDDYLYITSEKDKAQRFLDRMHQGFSDYGIFINKGKTQSNLFADTEINYYGFLFNTYNLEVYVKYVKYVKSENISYKNLVTFSKWEEIQQGYSILRNKMQRIPSYKLNRLTTDPFYMTPKGLARNVFETACLMACCYKTTVHAHYHEVDPAQLIDIVNYCAIVVTRKLSSNGSLLKKEIYWIVIRAFKMCMSVNAVSGKKGFPECILPYLEDQEEKAKMNTRLKLRRMIYDIVDELPVQYRNGH